MHGGRIVGAVVKAIHEKTSSVKYQIPFEKDQTALVGGR
jgi:hypothetical protein